MINWRYKLGDLTDKQVDEIVRHYNDFVDVEMDNDELVRCCQGDAQYSPALLYKVFFWYIYNTIKPAGFNGVVKLR